MQVRDVAAEAGGILFKSSPGAAGTVGTAFSGEVVLSVLVGCATLIFVIVQVSYAVWKWRRNSQLPGMIP